MKDPAGEMDDGRTLHAGIGEERMSYSIEEGGDAQLARIPST
jgi:hypothetical protein